MDATTENGQAPTPETEPSAPKKGLPAWAWSVIGVVVGAALIGGAWLAFGAGRSAPPPVTTASVETSFSESVEVATESVEPAVVAQEPTPTAPASGSSSSGSSSGGSSGSSGGSSSSGSSSSGSSSSGKKLAVKPNAPVNLWKTYVSHSGTGNWTSDAFYMEDPAVVRVTIKIKATNGGPAALQFNKTTMAAKTYWKELHTEIDYYYESSDIEIVGGWQRVKVNAGSGVSWTVTAKGRKD